jgi:HPr kinase/phosphorylase
VIDRTALTLHATAVAVGDRGLLIRGASGRGKSGLALEMMARGALLVADDGVVVHATRQGLRLSCAPNLNGMIEARGLGLLGALHRANAQLAAVLDLDHIETQRLPPFRETEVLGQKIPLLHFFDDPYFPAGLVQYLKGGRRE